MTAHLPQPGALDAAGLRGVVAVLSTVQVVSWGVLYYAFVALQSSITSDTGWSPAAVTGAFSLSQLVSGGVGIWVGRHIEDRGPRRVMTAGSVLAVPAVTAVASAPNLGVFYVGWALTGAAMAATLYFPAFAALTRWGGSQRIRALTTLTLVAGLASTVFAPLASVLGDSFGWRGAYLVLLGVLVIITVPLHWWGLNQPWAPAHHSQAPEEGGPALTGPAGTTTVATVATVVRSTPFVLLTVANALTALSVYAVIINMVPLLVEQGMSRNLAAVALGLSGAGQIFGRLGYSRFAGVTSVTTRGVVVLAAVSVATFALALAPPSPGLLIFIGMVLGLARGVYTLVHATAVTDRWVPACYGRLNGLLSAPALIAGAVAPFAGSILASVMGSYSAAFVVLAGVAAVAAVLMAGATPAARPGSGSAS